MSTPVSAHDQIYKTTCNAYYNNRGRVFSSVPCTAWFRNERLTRVNVYLPHVRSWYDWSIKFTNVTQDPVWKECIRHTGTLGNQWQICTVDSFTKK